MFKVGDYVVCPGHGVGQILNIEEKEVEGTSCSFYNLKINSNGMTVMIPVTSKDVLRVLVNDEGINEVFKLLGDHDVTLDSSTWNRRHREYMLKIKTGSLTEIAEVLRDLFLLKKKKSLSFGEKKILDQCKELIVQEISLAGGEDQKIIKNRIDANFEDLTEASV
jgi:CarD family transcriptional regulator